MNSTTLTLFLFCVALAAGLVWHWYEARQRDQRLTLTLWLNQLAHEIIYALPADLIDRSAARAWLLGQIEAFSSRYGLDPLFDAIDPSVAVDWLLNLLAGLWQGQGDLRAQTQMVSALWAEMLAERQPQLSGR